MKWKMEAEIPQKSRAYMRWKKVETSILQTIQSLYEID
jgi:hypothetical protein